MQSDQHTVRTKLERVTNHVATGGNIKHAMLRDGLLNDGGLSRRSIAFRTKASQVDPSGHWRQTPDRVRRGRRQGLQRYSIIFRLDFSACAQRWESKSMGKDLHLVYLPY